MFTYIRLTGSQVGTRLEGSVLDKWQEEMGQDNWSVLLDLGEDLDKFLVSSSRWGLEVRSSSDEPDLYPSKQVGSLFTFTHTHDNASLDTHLCCANQNILDGSFFLGTQPGEGWKDCTFCSWIDYCQLARVVCSIAYDIPIVSVFMCCVWPIYSNMGAAHVFWRMYIKFC